MVTASAFVVVPTFVARLAVPRRRRARRWVWRDLGPALPASRPARSPMSVLAHSTPIPGTSVAVVDLAGDHALSPMTLGAGSLPSALAATVRRAASPRHRAGRKPPRGPRLGHGTPCVGTVTTGLEPDAVAVGGPGGRHRAGGESRGRDRHPRGPHDAPGGSAHPRGFGARRRGGGRTGRRHALVANLGDGTVTPVDLSDHPGGSGPSPWVRSPTPWPWEDREATRRWWRTRGRDRHPRGPHTIRAGLPSPWAPGRRGSHGRVGPRARGCRWARPWSRSTSRLARPAPPSRLVTWPRRSPSGPVARRHGWRALTAR